MAKTYVRDVQPGEAVDSTFAVRAKSLAPFRSKPGSFLSMILADRTGELPAKAWDNAEQLTGLFEVGDVIRVRGRVDEYQGAAQLIVQRLKRLSAEEVDPLDYLPTTPKDVGDLLAFLQQRIPTVENPHLRALLESFFADEDFVRRFTEAPGAKSLHHAYLGGLLEHVVAIVRHVELVCEIHPQLDRDLLLTSAVLHDIGKMAELSFGTTIDYTDEGRLVGHVILGDRMIRDRIAQLSDFPPQLRDVLAHTVLSHHGAREWGAPIVPMTAEAIALHYIDNLDAKIWQFSQIAREAAEAGRTWSDWQRLLERYIYAGGWAGESASGEPGSLPGLDEAG